LVTALDSIQRACNQNDNHVLRAMLIELVPEHTGLAQSNNEKEKGAVIYPWKQTK